MCIDFQFIWLFIHTAGAVIEHNLYFPMLEHSFKSVPKQYIYIFLLTGNVFRQATFLKTILVFLQKKNTDINFIFHFPQVVALNIAYLKMVTPSGSVRWHLTQASVNV